MIGNLRATAFYLGASIAAFVTYLLMLVARPAPRRIRYRLLAGVARVILTWLRLTCGIRHEVSGGERVPAGPVVFLVKHQSSWETMALMTLLPRLSFVLKKELVETPVLGYGLRAMEPVAIDRALGRRALRAVVLEGQARLEAGRSVVVFPEGTRIPPGGRGVYRRSGAELARKAGVPVVPVAHDSGSCWPHGELAKRPGTIHLIFGPAIDTRERSAAEVTAAAERWIEAQVAALQPSGPSASERFWDARDASEPPE